eukprot:CAMPEP_0115652010 /NCGR_PEP_ID=MMETSP0272-20121206/41845_1 /TAXON_ID=71861 /ORGANISM="Scrippsiella trochoidea, Strain CCMP3099" /LENGTH=384 /DNA_ID=CAMNT_0003089795 /DNA_START=128 /DNA_END=1280 /DNA_ORIENTATION=-
MVRHNKAPPPLTPWRAEVLEAQRQIQAANKRSRSRSRSRSRERSRSRSRGKRAKDKSASASAQATTSGSTSGSTSGRRPDASAVAPETGVVLRQARERGEGWYAAVARAAEAWDSISSSKKLPKGGAPAGQVEEQPPAPGKKASKEQAKQRRQGKDKDIPGSDRSAVRKSGEDFPESERRRREEEQREEERQRLEFEARAEERRVRAEEERRKAEEERQRSEKQKQDRQARLKGAFAVGGDDSDDEGHRNAKLLRQTNPRRSTPIDAPAVAGPSQLALTSAAAGAAALARGPSVDHDLSERLRFEPGLNPAEAFMRLQERKRKGRRAEFGGPPRGCSPWRDGKRGVTFEKEESKGVDCEAPWDLRVLASLSVPILESPVVMMPA